MKSWMISANQKKYNHDASFEANGHVDWIKYGNYSVGDIVYIYYSKPNIMELRRKCVVSKIHEDISTVTDDSEFWTDRELYKTSRLDGNFARLEPLQSLGTPVSLATLRSNGLKQPPQTVKLLNNDKPVLEFIESVFDTPSKAELVAWTKEDERVERTIKSRRGQAEFRKLLIKAYDGKCCITESSVHEILEAAHIVPHAEETDYSVTNGLLFRSDIHTLFDLHLIWVTEKGIVGVSEVLRGTEYEKYSGKQAIKDIPKAMSRNLAKKLAIKGT